MNIHAQGSEGLLNGKFSYKIQFHRGKESCECGYHLTLFFDGNGGASQERLCLETFCATNDEVADMVDAWMVPELRSLML